MSLKRTIAIVVAVAVAPPVLVAIVFSGLCDDKDISRRTSPDSRTVAIERDEACLNKHVTALYLERPGLPRMTLVRAMKVYVTELEWHGDRELWVTLAARADRAANATDDAPRRFDDVTIRYFNSRREELRSGP